MMKLISVASVLLAIVHRVEGQICPDVLTTTEGITSSINLSYQIVVDDSPDERDILCVRLESDSEGYLGFAVAETEEMIGGEAIIGLPDEETVLKYYLGGKATSAVELRPEEEQTLMETSIFQDVNGTVLRFAKYLNEDGEIEIVKNGNNIFLYAAGSNNDLGYHGSERGIIDVDFMMDSGSSSGTFWPTIETTPSPTPFVSQGSSPGGTFVSVAEFAGKTMAPTQGFDGTKPPVTPPAPKPGMSTEDNEVSAPSETSAPSESFVPENPEVPESPAPPATSPNTNGSVANSSLEKMMYGVFALAFYFGV